MFNPWLRHQGQIICEMSMTRHPTGVQDQFNFGKKESNTACMPISLMALYHMYDTLGVSGQLPTSEDWSTVMHNGTLLWKKWRESNRDNVFPLVEEILQLKACRPFLEIFGNKPEKRAGLVKNSKEIENPEGSLFKALNLMVRSAIDEKKDTYAILTLPVNHTLALMCKRDKNSEIGEYHFYLFDPHGDKTTSGTTKESVFLEFIDKRIVSQYITERFDITNIDHIKPEIKKLYNHVELANYHNYSIEIFIK